MATTPKPAAKTARKPAARKATAKPATARKAPAKRSATRKPAAAKPSTTSRILSAFSIAAAAVAAGAALYEVTRRYLLPAAREAAPLIEEEFEELRLATRPTLVAA